MNFIEFICDFHSLRKTETQKNTEENTQFIVWFDWN